MQTPFLFQYISGFSMVYFFLRSRVLGAPTRNAPTIFAFDF